MTRRNMKRRNGFTLIELLVVIIIIGILAGIGMSQYRDAMDRARSTNMISLVRAVQLGVESWRTDYSGCPQHLTGTAPAPDLSAPTGTVGALAANDASIVDANFPVKYVPGGLLPRTPWASRPQLVTQSGFDDQGNPFTDSIIGVNPTTTVDQVMQPGYCADGGDPTGHGGTMPATGAGPAQRVEYGYMYYVGDSASSKYMILGVGKRKDACPIVAIKHNF